MIDAKLREKKEKIWKYMGNERKDGLMGRGRGGGRQKRWIEKREWGGSSFAMEYCPK